MPTINPSSDSFLHSPFCFLSSLVAPSSTSAFASGLSSSEFPYRWEWVCAFLVVVADYGRPGFWGAGKTVGRWLSYPGGPYRQVSRVTIRSFANVPLSVEAGSDGPYLSVCSICPSRITGTGRMLWILQGSDWLYWVGVRHYRSYNSPSLERPARSFGSLPLRTFGCYR